MLEVDVELDPAEPGAREMVKRLVQAEVPGQPRVKDRVGEHQLPTPCAQVELDHVDADPQRGVERLDRVRLGERARPAMTDSLAAVHGTSVPPATAPRAGSDSARRPARRSPPPRRLTAQPP